MNKVLRINMDSLNSSIEEAPAAWGLYGGRALTSTIVATEVDPACDPLGPRNKLVFAPGLLSGTTASDTGRLSAGAKSPLTGGIKESSSGGTAGQMLARLGYKALIIEGRPHADKWYSIHVHANGATIEEESELIGQGNFDVLRALEARLGPKFGSLSIGQAGELRMAAANISVRDVNGNLRSHGRGGLGAVMGSKRVKFISIDAKLAKTVQAADPGKFQAAGKTFAQTLINHPALGQGMKNFGTAMLVGVVNSVGGLPTRNFSSGYFQKYESISGETIRDTITARGGETTDSCQPGCVIQCSQVYVDPDRNYVTSGFEYETIGLLGSNCEISNLDLLAEADHLMDDLGIDSMETGVAFGVAMEAGVLPFGDGASVVRILKEEVARGTPLGRVLGAGAASVGRVYGLSRVPVVKGQGMPAYDPRPMKGMGITYATSPMGADHTAGHTMGPNINGMVPGDKKSGQVELSRMVQIVSAAIDAFGICTFATIPLAEIAECKPAIVDMINARFGTNQSAEQLFDALGKYILKTERQFNLRAGFTAQHDRLPEFMAESLPPRGVSWDFTDSEIDVFWNF